MQAENITKLAGSSSAGEGASAALLPSQTTGEQHVSDSCSAMALFVQLAYILLHFSSFHSFCHSCSMALTAVQHFQKCIRTVVVQLHNGLQPNRKVQTMVQTCCVADSAARAAMNSLSHLHFAAHFLQPGVICLL